MERQAVYGYIEKEIWKIPIDRDPITVNDYRWHELIEESGDIFNKVVEKFNLRSVMIIDEGDYCRNTDRGTDLYYYIEDKLLSNFRFEDPSYLTNYNNADEHEIYGVNPLDYEK